MALTLEDISGIALDLGGTKIAAARIEAGRVVQSCTAPTTRDATAPDLLASMHRLTLDLDLSPTDPVGMAVTGRVGQDGAWHAVNTHTLPGLDGANVSELASARFDRPVPVRNDALAAGLAEHRFGGGMGSAAMAYITVSTGVGGGLILNGAPLVSANGLSGHLGFSITRLGERRCGSGRLGTVESVASGRAIMADAIDAGHHVTCAGEVFDAAHQGAGWAEVIINRSANAIAELCGNLAAILGIDRVVLGGSVGLAEGYAHRVRDQLDCEPALFRPEVVTAAFQKDAELLGALIET